MILEKRDRWYPAVESTAVVGRVIEVETLHPGRSKEAGKPVYYMAPVMESKVVAHTDIAHQYLGHLPEHEREAICNRFPGAWENFIAHKGKALGEEVVVPEVVGTPIGNADWLPREKLAWLRLLGFETMEQLAGLSDGQLQQLGTGSRTWKKKATQYLASPPQGQ